MEVKPKKCKGIGKCNGIEGCGTLSTNRKFGLCPSCLWEWMCKNDNGKVYREKQFIPRVKKATEKENKRKTKEQREALKSIARLIQEARVPFQKWIRIRDANEACISCGDVNAKIWHSGHYKKAELFTGIIFNEYNVNKQCEKCNTFLNGNESEYRIGLVKKIGHKAVLQLEESANHLRQYKFSRQEIKDIKTKYQKRLKDERTKDNKKDS